MAGESKYLVMYTVLLYRRFERKSSFTHTSMNLIHTFRNIKENRKQRDTHTQLARLEMHIKKLLAYIFCFHIP